MVDHRTKLWPLPTYASNERRRRRTSLLFRFSPSAREYVPFSHHHRRNTYSLDMIILCEPPAVWNIPSARCLQMYFASMHGNHAAEAHIVIRYNRSFGAITWFFLCLPNSFHCAIFSFVRRTHIDFQFATVSAEPEKPMYELIIISSINHTNRREDPSSDKQMNHQSNGFCVEIHCLWWTRT